MHEPYIYRHYASKCKVHMFKVKKSCHATKIGIQWLVCWNNHQNDQCKTCQYMEVRQTRHITYISSLQQLVRPSKPPATCRSSKPPSTCVSWEACNKSETRKMVLSFQILNQRIIDFDVLKFNSSAQNSSKCATLHHHNKQWLSRT